MKTFISGTVIVLLAAAVATYFRYGNYDPCDWMEQDLAAESNLPRLAIKAKIKGEFLMRGVTDPDVGECLTSWWKFRAEGLPKDS